ncbi:hypothetical protein EV361DRAFT_964438 [Lentinula raphanica]|nr:hypothetical protein EV361DRAFT_964438 [Lentinula raphanica]
MEFPTPDVIPNIKLPAAGPLPPLSTSPRKVERKRKKPASKAKQGTFIILNPFSYQQLVNSNSLRRRRRSSSTKEEENSDK